MSSGKILGGTKRDGEEQAETRNSTRMKLRKERGFCFDLFIDDQIKAVSVPAFPEEKLDMDSAVGKNTKARSDSSVVVF